MLVVLGGLPGTGKSTIAREVASQLDALWLRIDAIEQTLRRSLALGEDVGEAGYAAAYAVAESHLGSGGTVIADCVNPLGLTRAAWRAVAACAPSPLLEVEAICSDAAEHRRRVETRESDLEGLALPDWAAVLARRYEPWTEPHLVIDTASLTPPEAAGLIVEAVRDVMRQARM